MGCFPPLFHGILNPLKMKGSKYHGGSTNHTEKGHFSKRRLNILWIKIDPLDQYTMGFIIPHYTGISLEQSEHAYSSFNYNSVFFISSLFFTLENQFEPYLRYSILEYIFRVYIYIHIETYLYMYIQILNTLGPGVFITYGSIITLRVSLENCLLSKTNNIFDCQYLFYQ